MKKKTILDKAILIMPGIVCATALRLLGLVSTTGLGLLYTLDIIGATLGGLWLGWSQRVSDWLWHKVKQ